MGTGRAIGIAVVRWFNSRSFSCIGLHSPPIFPKSRQAVSTIDHQVCAGSVCRCIGSEVQVGTLQFMWLAFSPIAHISLHHQCTTRGSQLTPVASSSSKHHGCLAERNSRSRSGCIPARQNLRARSPPIPPLSCCTSVSPWPWKRCTPSAAAVR